MTNYPVICLRDKPTRRPRQPSAAIPAALSVCVAVALAFGVMGYQGTKQDMKDADFYRTAHDNDKLAGDALAMERTVRVANAEDRSEKRLVSDSWLDDLGECNADINCRAQVAQLKPRSKK